MNAGESCHYKGENYNNSDKSYKLTEEKENAAEALQEAKERK